MRRGPILLLAPLLWGPATDVAAQAAASAPVPTTVPATVAPPPATGEPRFTLADGTVRVAPGQTAATFVLAAEGLGKAAMAAQPLVVESIGAKGDAEPGKSAAQPTAWVVEGELQPGSGSRRWLVTATAAGLSVNEEQSRFLRVRLGDIDRVLPYVLSHRARSTPEYTVVVNTPWTLGGERGDTTSVVVSTGDQPVPGLRLANAVLAEKTLGGPLRLQQLALCTTPADACLAPPLLPPLSSHTLHLRVTDPQRDNGRFSGTVSFAADGRADTKAVALEVHASTAAARVGGAALIVAGVLLAWQLTVVGRARHHYLTALKPATAARARIESLLARLDSALAPTGVDLPQLRAAYETMAAALQETALDQAGLLPTRWPAVWSAGTLPDINAHLKALEAPIAGFAVTIASGVEPLVERWRGATADGRTAVEAALRMLDVPASSATETLAAAAAAAAKATLPTPAMDFGGGGHRGGADAPAALVLQRISSEMHALSAGVWLAYLLLTALTGIVTLVLVNPGFGTGLDFVYCLFWGFGMPVTLEKLQQISPSGVATQVGITLPK